MRQDEARTTKHHHTPSIRARQPGRHKSNQIPRGRDQHSNWARTPQGTNHRRKSEEKTKYKPRARKARPKQRKRKKGARRGTGPQEGQQKDPYHATASGSKSLSGAQGQWAQKTETV